MTRIYNHLDPLPFGCLGLFDDLIAHTNIAHQGKGCLKTVSKYVELVKVAEDKLRLKDFKPILKGEDIIISRELDNVHIEVIPIDPKTIPKPVIIQPS